MNWFYVFVGGGLGSMLRYGISILLQKDSLSFPWPTFYANLISCLLVGFLSTLISKTSNPHELKLLFIIGFCGGFSTFSTFSQETLFLVNGGRIMMAITYVFLSVSIGIGCVILGSKIQI